MFDLSWLELSFVAALALIVIGPKDLPKLFSMMSHVMNKSKRMLNDVKGSVKQLENEINISQGQQSDHWKEYLPEEIQHLPDDFTPGSMSAEDHRLRRQAHHAAKVAAQAKQQQDSELGGTDIISAAKVQTIKSATQNKKEQA
ncbi:hypothetical protein Patl_2609 [Paraglaciecola sp. T6c]|uniref:Sec-independent protein translocase subunit TatA/TatB n=1 Tax=Pseudoalteromonas atlantica (strain T6c / ATCC BAA-1087) TaxID=3042615 RepID=UPI00005C5C68|nr:hypothetical protein [Paraglaciecola sp. T6c]ABG41124.1 hypothetical protein Patl_2609 [Paraglaciecola sp. T6c]